MLGVLDLPVGPPPPTDPRPLPAGTTRRRRARRHVLLPAAGVWPTTSTTPVLRHVSLHIPAGQQVALVGATGSGKTTLGRLIARFADPTIGEIRLGDVPLQYVANRGAARAAGRGLAGAVPVRRHDRRQHRLRPPGHVDAPTIESMVDRLDVRDWLATGLPDGLTTRVGERGEQLSAGERQLVALLRAGIADPDVLVLDEATSSVDALTEVRTSPSADPPGRGSHHDRDRPPSVDRGPRRPGARARRRPVGRRTAPHAELVAVDGRYAQLYAAWMAHAAVTHDRRSDGSAVHVTVPALASTHDGDRARPPRRAGVGPRRLHRRRPAADHPRPPPRPAVLATHAWRRRGSTRSTCRRCCALARRRRPTSAPEEGAEVEVAAWLEEIRNPIWHGTPAEKAEEAFKAEHHGLGRRTNAGRDCPAVRRSGPSSPGCGGIGLFRPSRNGASPRPASENCRCGR